MIGTGMGGGFIVKGIASHHKKIAFTSPSIISYLLSGT